MTTLGLSSTKTWTLFKLNILFTAVGDVIGAKSYQIRINRFVFAPNRAMYSYKDVAFGSQGGLFTTQTDKNFEKYNLIIASFT